MRTVAVIGAGISGLAVSWLLSRRYRVLLFEKDDRLGGHTHTVVVEGQNGPLPLDTGFLVHNERTYPNLVRLFRELGVETRDSDMSFGVSCRRTGLEYSSRGLTGFFAQPSNLVSPRHLDLLREIVRFNREAPALLTDSENGPTLGEFLESRRFGDVFTDSYLLPMASAIWSTALAEIRRFPAAALVRFFHNHGLLTLTAQPTWKVVVGGSHVYVPRLVSPLADSVYRGVTINAVNRTSTGVTLAFVGRPSVQVDEVVFACHGDQVLPILSDPSDAEREVLGRFRTTTNVACLHTDSSYLPVRARARASWNYLLAGPPEAPPVVTYDLNRLQGLDTRAQYCVTLNPLVPPQEDCVIGRYTYSHPLYDSAALSAQRRWADISGRHRTHYCGAYWGYGFHEDGLNSAIRVAAAMGVTW